MSLARAIETGDLAELPSRRDEAWRWTDLKGLIRQLPPRSAPDAGALPRGPFDAIAHEAIAIVNGDLRTRIAMHGPGEQLLALRIVGRGDGAHAAAPKLNVAAGERLVLLESHEGEGAYVSELDLTLNVAEGGEVERIVLAHAQADAVQVARCDVFLSPGARYAQTVLAAGGRRQRIETHVIHPGGGAAVRLDGIYVVGERRHADLTTVVTHAGPRGTTLQLTKGVAAGQGRAVFQGRITVDPGADQTDARMGHHALLLSDRAEVDAKPELEIFADDVACAHGNTVGALDEDALFYAQQRGMPEPVARALLTEAFVGEVIDRIQHEEAREIARAWAAERLREVTL
jgi:Fe-S cluster assembly protein SufD